MNITSGIHVYLAMVFNDMFILFAS